jgi:hypothetical protein
MRSNMIQSRSGDSLYDFDPAIHDALVLVHPTYSMPKSGSYVQAILGAIDAALAAGRPVFHAADHREFEALALRLAKRQLEPVPDFRFGMLHVKDRVNRRRGQREVDFIAARIGRRRSEIRLGFAGMYASACVFAFARSWCRQVVPWWPEEADDPPERILPRHRLGRADILQNLVLECEETLAPVDLDSPAQYEAYRRRGMSLLNATDRSHLESGT